MAKQSLPSVESVLEVPGTVEEKQEMAPAEDLERSFAQAHVSRDVYAKNLTRKQALKLKNKVRELTDTGEKLENGKFVNNKSLVVKWLIEKYC